MAAVQTIYRLLLAFHPLLHPQPLSPPKTKKQILCGVVMARFRTGMYPKVSTSYIHPPLTGGKTFTFSPLLIAWLLNIRSENNMGKIRRSRQKLHIQAAKPNNEKDEDDFLKPNEVGETFTHEMVFNSFGNSSQICGFTSFM